MMKLETYKVKKNISVAVSAGVLVVCAYVVFHDTANGVMRSPSFLEFAERSDRHLHPTREEELSLVAQTENMTTEALWELEKQLKSASFRNNTIILTTINEAWAATDSLLDIFMESFNVGEGTAELLGHVVMVTLDEKAYNRCQAVHQHCYKLMTEEALSGEKLFMTKDYLKVVWKKIELMRIVLKMGYNFVFSDADILWLRDPFPYFSMDADAAFSCDFFNGNETDLGNTANTGFLYVRSNNRTLELFNLWIKLREFYPGMHDQDVMGLVKTSKEFAKVGVKFRFLSPNVISGFCSVSQDYENICTMHANCCTSIQRKIRDLRTVIERWKYMRSRRIRRSRKKASTRIAWRVPKACVRSWT